MVAYRTLAGFAGVGAKPGLSANGGLSRLSAYRLREAQAEGQYCTAEVAIALLDMAGDTGAAAGLGEHFTRFKTRYLAGKTQHLGSITAEQLESV